MSLIFWTTYTATLRGVRLKQVCCEKCGGYYYYEMIRAAQGKAASLYNIDLDGAADRSAKNASMMLYRELRSGNDPIACPNCGHLQSSMNARLAATPAAKGMPPALIWTEQAAPDGATTGSLVTARPLPKVTAADGPVVLQLPRVTLPAACCNCGQPADKPLRYLFQLGNTPENLGLFACDACTGQLRSKSLLMAGIGWLLALTLGACIYVALGEESQSTGGMMAVLVATVVLGGIMTAVLPNMLVPPFAFKMLNPQRAIASLKFRNLRYATLAAAAVVDSHNAGQVFADETNEQASQLASVVD